MKKILSIIGIVFLFVSCAVVSHGTTERPLTILEIKRDYGLNKTQLKAIEADVSIERHYHCGRDAIVFNSNVDYSTFKK